MSEVTAFVREALAVGKSREEIRGALLAAGWGPDEVRNALRRFAEVEFPVPVPRPARHLSARDAFLHLVAFFTLYLSVLGLGTLLFQFVNLAFPDPLLDAEYYRPWLLETIRFSAASLLIAFPVYLWVNRLLQRAYRESPEQRSSPVRRWLTYATLFLAAAIVIGYLISLVFRLLGGELAGHFVLKVMIVTGIAGTVFAYYLPGLRRDEQEELGEKGPEPWPPTEAAPRSQSSSAAR